jgi:hypothetical protein
MPLLDVVQSACEFIGVEKPTGIFTNINNVRTQQELLACANETAQRTAYDFREWNALKLVATLAGDGVTDTFNLPANLKRMLLRSDVWRSSTPGVPMRFIPDLNEWIDRRNRNWFDNRGEWIIYGGQMHIQPIMGVGVNATFAYLDKNCIALHGGGNGTEFLDDADTYRLDERVLKLGMIWIWKSNKGSPYAEDLNTFGDALTMVAGADSPAPTLIGSAPASNAIRASVAYPWPLPTP